MKPILFDYEGYGLDTNGVGVLRDCLSCVVTEEVNGIYECEFTYPITGKYYNELINGPDGENLGIIGVVHDHNGDIQPFDIYKYSAPINGVVTFYARHVSYRLTSQIVGWENGLTVTNTAYLFSTVLQGPDSPVYPSGATFSWVDHANYTTAEGHSMSWKGPVTARQLMFTGYRTDEAYGTESIIKSFPGEFRFDRFDVHYYRQRGSYNGVQIRYGKNMTGINREKDVSEVVTAVFPYWMSKDDPPTIVYGTLQQSPHVGTYYHAAPLDLSDKFETRPTEARLNEQALLYMEQNNTWKPQETITVDMVDLYSTTNADFTKITVGDYVDVIYTGLGVVAEQVEVISATFDVLAERFTQIQCGQFPETYAEVVTGMVPSGGSSGGGSAGVVEVGSYTPTFWWSGGGTAPTVTVTTAAYTIVNGMMTLYLRFQITNAGTGRGNLRFSLPTGWTCEFATLNAPVGVVVNDNIEVEPISVVRVAGRVPALYGSLTGAPFNTHVSDNHAYWGVFCVIPVRQS